MKTIKYIKNLKEFNTNTLEQLKLWAYEYVKGNYEGFNELEDAVEYLDWFFQSIYTEIMKNKQIILYRVIKAESKDDINLNKIGIHTVQNLETIYDHNFLDAISLLYNNSDDDLYILNIKTDVNNIHWKWTIDNRLRFPNESEITLKEDWKGVVKITNFEKEKLI